MTTKDRSMVEARNGYVTIDVTGNAPPHGYIIRSKRDDAASVALDLTYDGMVELRAMLWGAMRRQGRGTEISIEELLRIEEVRHKGRYSVEGYKEEINWTIDLLQRHLTRIEHWQDDRNCGEAGDAYGKLDEFLSELEE